MTANAASSQPSASPTWLTGKQPEARSGRLEFRGVDKLFAELEVSAIASAGFHKEHYPEDTVQIRSRADGTLRTVLGHARLE